MKKKIKYVEPTDYFPKEFRKKYKLGEYSDINVDEVKEKTDIKEENNKDKKIENKIAPNIFSLQFYFLSFYLYCFLL